MAKWKLATHMAVAMREAEKQAEVKRVADEQRAESIKNSTALRSMQRQRSVVGRRAKVSFVKAERLCNNLNTEHTERTLDVQVANSPYYMRQDKFCHDQLMENIGKFDAGIEEGKKIKAAIHLVDLKERETDAELFKLQLKLKKINFDLSNVHVISPSKVTGRMDVAHQQYGTQLEENRRLVAQINHLEGERQKVLEMHRKLEHSMEELSKQLAGYLEEAKTTYDQRDMNKRNMAKLREHLEKSKASYVSDMQLLQFKIDVLKRMERFMTTKNKFRPDEGKERRRQNRKNLSASEKDTAMFAGLMAQIRTDLQEDDLHVIIKTFMELEEENYMLFKNISETRDSCHTMQVELKAIQGKIEGLRKANQLKEQEALARKMELVEKIQICNKEATQKEESIAQADEMIATYIRGIMDILTKLGYTQEEILRLAGVYKRVEERNIRVFLAEIERYVNQLYEVKTTADYLEWEQRRKLSMTQPQPEPLPPRFNFVQRVVVVPPQHEEGDDIDDPSLPTDAAFRPLSCAEMTFHVDEDLESRAGEELGIEPVASHHMTDPTSEAIADFPHPRSPGHTKMADTVDIF